jgi:hypothetical protein
MIDVNGREIVTGDIVEVLGAYFQRHNGYWIVTRSPGDKNWLGGDHSLVKVSKSGKVSYAKYNLSTWPLCHFITNQKVADEARQHDRQHASIRVIGHINMHRDDFEKSNPNRVEYINWSRALTQGRRETKCSKQMEWLQKG